MIAIRKDIIIRELKFIFGFALVSVAQTYLMCTSCTTNANRFAIVSLYCFSIWVLLWRGNSFVTHFIDTKISWLEYPVKRFIVGTAATIGYSVGMILSTMFFFQVVFNFQFGDGFIPTLVYSVLITIIVSLFLHGRAFLLNWRKLELDSVKLRNENLSSRYESLKSQLDPHFLFNSLNVLTNLVYQDADKATKFIKQLSEVYRYVLDSRNKELVPLAEELKFVDSYLFLQQIRFGDKLIIDNKLYDQAGLVPPLALQLLVENAIKHNIISEENPLKITMYQREAFLNIENNLQRKNSIQEEITGIGLENIRKRYEFLTGKQIEVEEDQQRFLVRLPHIENTER